MITKFARLEFELFTEPSKSNFLKPKIPSAKFQTGFLRDGGKAIVFLFGILNFGHCNLFVFWDLLFGSYTNSITP